VGTPWVVVGAGSAGCVVAARLSQEPDRGVLLIEAGPDLTSNGVPEAISGANFLAAGDLSDRNEAGLLASRVTAGPATPYRRGRGVGGSSAVNAMVALRGDGARYRSWGWHDVDAAWAAVALPVEPAADHELGAVDRALLAAEPRARPAPLNRRDGRRVTSAEAYLWPALDRPNLRVRTGTTIDRIVLDGRRAIGVVTSDGEEVAAERVVVSAGAIHSPALLLRSGIDGPGIGHGLQDHPSVPLTLALRDGVPTDPDGLVIGSLWQGGGIQFLPMNHLGSQAPGLGLLLVALMTPHSRGGTVGLDPDDPQRAPRVDFAMLTDPSDRTALAAGVLSALAMLRTAPFAEIVDQVYIDASGTTADALADTSAIERWLPTVVGDYVHASSTCAMGPVVDGEGAVHGYEGLYVCDASVFPAIPDVNTHLPTTMLAERLTARWRSG
jgi:choline dehydrogenase-like flavoprotein